MTRYRASWVVGHGQRSRSHASAYFHFGRDGSVSGVRNVAKYSMSQSGAAHLMFVSAVSLKSVRRV